VADNTPQDQENTGSGANAGTPPAPAKQKSPAEELKAARIKEVKAALASFPKLKEGYVTPRGVFFDMEAALASADGDEDQVTVVKPAKK
jgi:hypothetical protein